MKINLKILSTIVITFLIFVLSPLTNLRKGVYACVCSQVVGDGCSWYYDDCTPSGLQPQCSSDCSSCVCVSAGGGGGIPIGSAFGSPWGIGNKGLGYFVSVILSNAVAIAGVLLLFLLIFGGISIMMGAGSGNKDDVAKGKKAVTAAVAGFLIIFLAYWIIRIVEIITGYSILNPGI